ncbi:hypothetical protein KFK09_027377 [Dendrobium nobile]|uniref:Late embryogenesis abundant protein LEA-2 subgroup domain-containing protein n=1 Tax=Dendrobium nobile TaxID=94219 RepID=A0A8T3AAV7_DENNO|nr:hypothetical protein KFK09_027377 [Dendrobium nobile]
MEKPDQEETDHLIPPPPRPPPCVAFFADRSLQPSTCSCSCLSLLSPSSLLFAAAALSFLGSAIFLLWPSDPHLHVARISIDRVHVAFHPSVSVSVDLHLRISIHNPDFFSLDYDALDVAIGYREQRLGSVLSAGGHVRARGVSYVDAELHLDGIEVLHDIFYLIEDLARRSIPFDTVTEIRGLLHFLFFDVPIKGRISCLVNVNPTNHTVIRHDCHIQ